MTLLEKIQAHGFPCPVTCMQRGPGTVERITEHGFLSVRFGWDFEGELYWENGCYDGSSRWPSLVFGRYENFGLAAKAVLEQMQEDGTQ